MSTTINCVKCGQLIELSSQHMGMIIKCPSCSAKMQAPDPEYKKCPACAEMVKFEAIKCKHCDEPLDYPKKAKPVNNIGCIPSAIIIGVAILVIISIVKSCVR